MRPKSHWQPKPSKDDHLSDIAHDLARLLPRDPAAQKSDADLPTLRRVTARDLGVLAVYLSEIVRVCLPQSMEASNGR